MNDTTTYTGDLEHLITTVTIELTLDQYNDMKTFGDTAGGLAEWQKYNGLNNSCVDFVWAALKAAGLNPTGFQGDVFPKNNIDDLKKLLSASIQLTAQLRSATLAALQAEAQAAVQAAAQLPEPSTPTTTREIKGDLKPKETNVITGAGAYPDSSYFDTTKWKYAGCVGNALDANQTDIWTFYQLDDLGNYITEEVAVPDQWNYLKGSSGNDHIISGGGIDFILATQGGDDLIETGTGRDYVEAGAGNNVIEGGADGDILISGNGNDALYADTQLGASTAIVLGNSQTGTGQQGDWLAASGGDDTLIGCADNDVLMGGAGSDLLIGGAGDDDIAGDGDFKVEEFSWSVYNTPESRIFVSVVFWEPIPGEWAPAGGAADVIYAGGGNDHAWGGSGNDVVFGEGGNDYLVGDGGDDTVIGGEGDDTLYGDGSVSMGDDYLDGGAGNDTLWGDDGNDILIGDIGDDKLYGGTGANYMDGGDGDDELASGGSGSTLFGGAGDDRIFAEGGSSYLDGEEGNNVLVASGGNNELFAGSGNDTLTAAGGNSYLDGGDGNNTLEATGGGNMLTAGAGNDILAAAGGNNYLDGGDGNNSLYAESGGNTLLAGTGDDTLSAYGGNNSLDGGDGNDTLTAAGGHSYLAGGDGNNTLTADGGNNTLTAGEGDDTLNAGGGNNYLDGGNGNNSLYAESGGNTLLAGAGDDTLQASGGGNYLDAGGGTNSLIADGGSNNLTGGTGNDYLSAMGGTNNLDGGSGNDTLTVDGAGNTLLGGAGNDQLYVYGAGSGNRLDGGADNDILQGGSGDDTLVGGAGNDTLVGGAGQDTYIYSRGGGVDTIDDTDSDSIIEFGEGIDSNSVALRLGSLLLDLGNGDAIHIGNFDRGDVFNSSSIGSFKFADGSTLTTNELLARGFDIVGTEGDDVTTINTYTGAVIADHALYGTNTTDRISGLGGNDTLYGGDGNDTLDGGAGNDILQGGAGSDTYLFGRGGGQDTIYNLALGATADKVDAVQFASDVSSTNVTARRTSADALTLSINGTTDTLTIADYFTNDGNSPVTRLEEIRFTGTVWTVDQIKAMVFQPSSGNDELYGYSTNDAISGGDGNDSISGLAGDDVLNGDAGNDGVSGGEGNDLINGGTGDDSLSGDAGNDIVNGDAGNDAMSGGDGNDTVNGGTGDDWVEGNTGNDALDGGNGFDVLHGNSGDDTLSGGAGADYLYGGAGNDVYQFGRGSGQDTIEETHWTFDYGAVPAGNYDTVQFAANVLPSDVVVQREYDDLVLRISGTSDVLRVRNYFYNNTDSEYLVEEFRFANGTVWTTAQLRDTPGTTTTIVLTGSSGNDIMTGSAGKELLNGMAGNDVLSGGAGNDILNGGAGNDVLDGGLGNDTLNGDIGNDCYVFGRGSGQDTIEDYDYTAGNSDTIRFGAGIAASDITVTRSGMDMVLCINGTNDRLTVKGWGYENAYRIERVEFADGTAWDAAYIQSQIGGLPIIGTNGNDWLQGNDFLAGSVVWNNTLEGRGGNDNLWGGAGNDTYVFNRGDGQDTIYDYYSTQGYLDTIRFGEGIAASDITFTHSGNDLILGIKGTTDQMTIQYWGYGDVYRIERVEFADGTAWDAAYVKSLAAAAPVVGTNGADYLQGWSGGNNILQGFGGNDTLSGWIGNDILDGGAGNDYVSGQEGDDVYLFNRGDGQDTIAEYSATRNLDTIRFGAGIAASDIAFSHSGNDLVLSINGTTDRLTIQYWKIGYNYRIERVEFADGAVLDAAFLEAIPYTGTNGNDTLHGDDGNNTLIGLSGNDYLNSLSGNDLLDGGVGADMLLGGTGDDTYVVDNAGDVVTEALNAGTDTVQSSINYTLGTNVENLTLTGVDAINGTGNTLNNVITGNAANNELAGGNGNDVLAGGAGNDTYIINAGDGVDTIADNFSGGETNVIRFGAGVDPAQITLFKGSLGLNLGNGNVVHIEGVDYNDIINTCSIQRFEFFDGTVLTAQELVARGLDVNGGIGDDTLLGTNVTDRISGGNGADTLTGGQGDDMLLGGAGNDRYVFNPGDGADTILDAQGSDTLFIGGNLTEANLEGERDGDNMIVKVLGTSDTITLTGWFVQGEGVNRIEFADGSSLDHAGIEGLMNRPPVANPDAITVYEGSGATNVPVTALLANDTDTDANDIISVVSVGASAIGASVSLVDGQVQYDIRDHFQELGAGQTVTDSFDYTISDSKGATASSAVNVTITGINDAPVTAIPIAAQQTDEDAPFSFTIPANTFTDIDNGDTLTYSATMSDPSTGSGQVALPGWLTFDAATQTFSGTARNEDVGNFDVLVTATDTGGLSASGTFALNVINVNDTPTANAEAGAAQEDGGAVILSAATLLANDTDPDTIHGDTLNIVGISQAASGAVVSLIDGNVQYDPSPFDTSGASGQGVGALFQSLGEGQTATDTFSYIIADAAGATSTAQVTLTITGANDCPVVTVDATAAQEDLNIAASGNVLADDTDVDQGTVLTVANAGVFAGSYGQLTLAKDGRYTYALDNASLAVQSLATGQTATDTFAYQATDGMIATPSLLTVTITGTNDAPVTSVDVAAVQEDINISATGNVLNNDTDVDQGTVLSVADAGLRQGNYGQLTLNADGSYIYNVDNNSIAVQSLGRTAQVSEHFGYTVTDGIVSVPSALDVSLNGTNDAPILVAPLADQDFTFNKAFSWQMPSWSFADIDQGDVLDYSATLADGSPLPDWLNFDPVTQTFSGVAPKIVGYVDIRLMATDRVAATGSTVDSLATSDVFRLSISHGNEGVGNGQDAVPAGLVTNFNDGAGTSPGNPGACSLNNNILQGNSGNNMLTDTSGNNLFDGGAGDDKLTGGTGNELFIGGAGNDTITTGDGADIIAFNRGDGIDTVVAPSTGSGQAGTADNTLSLGGGIDYQSLAMSKSGNNLILGTGLSTGSGQADQIILQNWYSGTGNHSIANLQLVLDASAYDASTIDPLLNQQVQSFDFALLAQAFDQALAANSTLSAWNLTDSLLSAHLAGSDAAALGGDLAYQYNLNGTLAGIGMGSAQTVINDANFGVAPQLLQPLAGLQTGTARLG